jgi:hypothetical protein
MRFRERSFASSPNGPQNARLVSHFASKEQRVFRLAGSAATRAMSLALATTVNCIQIG